MRDRRISEEAVGYASLTFAPLLGWLTMAAVWIVVDSEGQGGIDIGVLFLGGGAAAAACAGYAALKRLPLPATIRWSMASFALTFSVGLIAILLLIGFLSGITPPAD